MTANEREETISLLNFSHQPSALSLGTAFSLQHCPEGKSPENIWEDERVEVVGRVL